METCYAQKETNTLFTWRQFLSIWAATDDTSGNTLQLSMKSQRSLFQTRLCVFVMQYSGIVYSLGL